MGKTFQDLYDRLVEVRSGRYRSDVDRQEAMLECLEQTMFTLLEKLRDKLDPM